MIVEKSEFVYLLNGYHGTVRNLPAYFKEAYYRLQKERAVTASAYMIVKRYTGVAIPKLEEFLKLNEREAPAKSVEEIKADLVSGGGVIIKE